MMPRDYRAGNRALAENINITLQSHPDSFECLIYRANRSEQETVAAVEDVVGSMEASERALSYEDPVPGRAFRVMEGNPLFAALVNSGDYTAGPGDEPFILFCTEDNLPKESLVEYEEYTSETESQLLSLYVVRSTGVGAAPGAKQLLHCMPFRGFDGVTP